MGLAAKKEVQKYTYADYRTWDDDERWEIIHGEATNMTPAPVRIHQEILTDLLVQLVNQLKDKPCKVYPAPFDVRLPLANENEEDISNIVQPDISVICDPGKLDEKGCTGAPDLIIEILSPSTRRRDRLEKLNLYEMAGVKEYWLVEPEGQLVDVFILGSDGAYGRSQMYTESDTIEINSLKPLAVDLGSVLKKPDNS
ncbi:MAG: Uma2 family endonuclease [bacterium]|nr:Uma2 family endonuclease [bacterium]